LETKSIKDIKNKKNGGDLECEEIIMNDKVRFGRVRTGVMKQLREQYGKGIADRALFRINKRVSQNSLRIKKHLNPYAFEKLE
jgi:hypothetical protein